MGRTEFYEIEVANDHRQGAFDKSMRKYNLGNAWEKEEAVDEAKKYIKRHGTSKDPRTQGMVEGYDDFLRRVRR